MTKKYKKMMLTRDTLSLDALAEEGDASLCSVGSSTGESVETEVFRNLCIKDIYAGLATLPSRQREVLTLIFGLGGRDKLSAQEIAWKLGENCTWVMLTARKALRHLRNEYGSRLEGYLEIAA
ncbi:MAG: hypothetical protein LBG72_10675 [Spirochaetaceae bacterium]|jgi:DNA-directed RNA polymerase sigma subunit (sigma70/sigma32)|nr:hypothetical protein [Spirochaetaceae bacterium]